MAVAERQALIQKLEQLRGSKVLAHLTSDRRSLEPVPGMTTVLASEPLGLIADLLYAMGTEQLPKLDLFLYTRGGDTNAVWPLVSLMREHARAFACLVPFRAHSAGTLICLAADEIVMTERAELSPIDPTTANQFNPTGPPSGAPLGISVEDVTAYMKLARDKEKVGVQSEEGILEVFKELTRSVHPLALGNVARTHAQIRFLAEKLLQTRDKKPDKASTRAIYTEFTEGFHTHAHAINRREARNLLGEDVVVFPAGEEADVIRGLFQQYDELFGFGSTFCASKFLGADVDKTLTVVGAIAETGTQSFIFETKVRITKSSVLPANVQVQVPPGTPVIVPGFPTQFAFEVLELGWVSNDEGR